MRHLVLHSPMHQGSGYLSLMESRVNRELWGHGSFGTPLQNHTQNPSLFSKLHTTNNYPNNHMGHDHNQELRIIQ